MGIFASNDSEEQADNIVFPERVLAEKLEYMAGELNGKIEELNDRDDVDLPRINHIPKFEEVEVIDQKISESYDSVSDEFPESRDTRRRLISARQRAQRLLEVYDTFRTMTDYDRVIDAIQVEQ